MKELSFCLNWMEDLFQVIALHAILSIKLCAKF